MGFTYDKPAGDQPIAPSDATHPEAVPSPALTPALARFRPCRWRRGPEEGGAECCSHRDVLPLAGANGFDPEAWCPDCTFFKLRRTPRKRSPEEYRY